MNKIKLFYKYVARLLFLVIVISVGIKPVCMNADTDKCSARNITLHVNSGDTYNIKALGIYYYDNTYVSLRDMALALSGTEKAFEVSVDSQSVAILTGQDYVAPASGNAPFSEDLTSQVYGVYYTLGLYNMTVNGSNVKIFSMIGSPDGVYDCFISLTDFALIFDVDIWMNNGELYIDTSKNFTIDINDLDERNYFSIVSSALVGDATTGEILYSYEGDVSVPIASTTKLMTYLVVMDSITRGSVSMDDVVEISANAEWIAYSEDGTILMDEGDTTSIEDLLYGLLLPSSNEAALVLAEHVAGNEQAFVGMMNETARNIGLSDETIFYNCNGLPVYTQDTITGKLQNHMTAEDMFKLVCYILKAYPQITDITSMKSAYLSSFGIYVNNTNFLLYNMPGVNGLKTGTTNKAGACLVSSYPVMLADGVHTVVAIEFGAENAYMRATVSQLLLTYGMQKLLGEEPDIHEDSSEIIIPDNAEELCQKMIENARKSK